MSSMRHPSPGHFTFFFSYMCYNASQRRHVGRRSKFCLKRAVHRVDACFTTHKSGCFLQMPPVHGTDISRLTYFAEDTPSSKPFAKQCNAEYHTDYAGTAVRWGLTHSTDSAADCCQACLDQAVNAKDGDMKCNIWVYCPDEDGCFSPDIYEHKHHECWLKQVSFFPTSLQSWGRFVVVVSSLIYSMRVCRRRNRSLTSRRLTAKITAKLIRRLRRWFLGYRE